MNKMSDKRSVQQTDVISDRIEEYEQNVATCLLANGNIGMIKREMGPTVV